MIYFGNKCWYDKNNNINGFAYEYMNNNIKYRGFFKNGLYEGKGILYDGKDNIIYKGIFKYGCYQSSIIKK